MFILFVQCINPSRDYTVGSAGKIFYIAGGASDDWAKVQPSLFNSSFLQRIARGFSVIICVVHGFFMKRFLMANLILYVVKYMLNTLRQNILPKNHHFISKVAIHFIKLPCFQATAKVPYSFTIELPGGPVKGKHTQKNCFFRC